MLPPQPLPQPLRGMEIPSFTHYSIVVRLPDIARRTLAENDFSPDVVQQIETLIAEIPHGKIRPLHLPQTTETEDWNAYTQPCLGLNWLEIPWFFAEEYFYIRILEATGYFLEGKGKGVDPYALQKRLGLETTRSSIHTLCEHIEEALQPEENPSQIRKVLERLLLVDLWGNQNDLSLWPASEGENSANSPGETTQVELNTAKEHILANDIPLAVDHIAGFTSNPARVDFLIDNAGFELVCDLALADYLISKGFSHQVVLHVKSYPVFVSDALIKDIEQTFEFLAAEPHEATAAMGSRLIAHYRSEKLIMRPDPFWTSPLAMWEMPPETRQALAGTGLIISKGDANYRRLLGDRHWPLNMPFAEVVRYLPEVVLALRTLKSEIAVGIPPEAIPENDPEWMSNGQWGLIQFSPPH